MRALFMTCSALPFLLLAPASAQEVLTGDAAFGTWEADAPGLRRHITPDGLPQPSHTENDPEAPDAKAFIRVKGVQFNTIPILNSEHGSIVEEELPFVFDDYEFL